MAHKESHKESERSPAMEVRLELYYDLAIGSMASAGGIQQSTGHGDW